MMIDINDYLVVSDQGDVRRHSLRNLIQVARSSLALLPIARSRVHFAPVELDGIEPTTSGLQSQRSPN
jgi:hypothetical protein